MEALSIKDYRRNLAASFDRAAVGEQVLIRRKNKLYALVSLGTEDVTLSKSQQRKLTNSIKRSLNEVKEIEAGRLPAKSAIDFLNEL